MDIFGYLVSFWHLKNAAEDGSGKIADIKAIIPLSYLSRFDGLTVGTEVALERAVLWKRRFPNAYIIFSDGAYAPGSAEKESQFKREVLKKAGVDEKYVIESAPSRNTIEEAVVLCAAIKERGIRPVNVLVIFGEIHSRRAHYIWKRIFGNVFFNLFPYVYEYEVYHPAWLERNKWSFLLINLVGHLLMRLCGLRIVSKLHHPVSVPK